jgi:ubiquinone biosynthesis protein COQ9
MIMDPIDTVSQIYSTSNAIAETAGEDKGDSEITRAGRRLVLAKIYGFTELRMLSDNSENFADTWSFLDDQISKIEDFKDIGNNFGDLAGVYLKFFS